MLGVVGKSLFLKSKFSIVPTRHIFDIVLKMSTFVTDKKYSVMIGSDHGGFAMKEALKQHLKESNVEVEDTNPAV